MSNSVNITYVNKSVNQDLPSVFIFTKNFVPSFNVYTNAIAWKIIDLVGRGSSCEFSYPIETQVRASWSDGSCKTRKLTANIGEQFMIREDSTGIVLDADGSASQTTAIDIINHAKISNGASAQLYKDGKLLMQKNIVAYNQRATFILHPKIYWGIASEIQEGEFISSAVINSTHFFEQNLEGVSAATVSLNGNAETGYYFSVDSQE